MKTTSTFRGVSLTLITIGVVVAVWVVPQPGWATLETALLSGLRLTVMAVTTYVGAVFGLTVLGEATRSRTLRRVTVAITVPVLRRVVAATLLLTPAIPLTAAPAPTELPDEAVGLPTFDEVTPPATMPPSPRQVEGWADTGTQDNTSDTTQPERTAHGDDERGRAPDKNEPADPTPERLHRKSNDTEEQDTAQDQLQPVTIRYVVQPGDNLWDITHSVLTDDQKEPPTSSEHASYWARVCNHVTTQLSSGDPDLIYPGETLTIPPP